MTYSQKYIPKGWRRLRLGEMCPTYYKVMRNERETKILGFLIFDGGCGESFRHEESSLIRIIKKNEV